MIENPAVGMTVAVRDMYGHLRVGVISECRPHAFLIKDGGWSIWAERERLLSADDIREETQALNETRNQLDPAAVRSALEYRDEARRQFIADRLTCKQYQYRLATNSGVLAEAARAWLAEHPSGNIATEQPS